MGAMDWTLVTEGTEMAEKAIQAYNERRRKSLSAEEGEAVMRLIGTMSDCLLLVSSYAKYLEEN